LVQHLAGEGPAAPMVSACATLAEAHQLLSDAGPEATDAVALASRLKPYLSKSLADQIVEKVLRERTPKFMYFDEYSIMAGKAQLTALADANQLQNNEGLRTLKELLDLAGTTPKELMTDANYEHHKAGLEAT